jgi:hypothetical protein
MLNANSLDERRIQIRLMRGEYIWRKKRKRAERSRSKKKEKGKKESNPRKEGSREELRKLL